MVGRLLIVRDDEDAPLIAELVLVRAFLDHSPSEAGIRGKEGIAVLCVVSRVEFVIAHHMEANLRRPSPPP
jgi:hypothetical protein